MSPSSQIPEDAIRAAEDEVARNCEHQLYAIQFDGVVKVGRSVDVNQRIPLHVKAGRSIGLKFQDFWISDRHANILTTEATLIRWCSEQWELANGMEWFATGDFDAITGFIEAMPKVCLRDSTRAAKVAEILLRTYPEAAVSRALSLSGAES